MLCQLGATVRLRDELEAWLPGFLAEDTETEDTETADAEAEATEAEGAEYAEEEGEPEGEPVQA